MPSSTSNSSEFYPLPEWKRVKPAKLVLVILGFALIWFAGDRLGAFSLSKLVDASQFRFARLYKGGNNFDYLVLGNSRGVNSCLVPDLNRLTDLNGFNLSYNGASPDVLAVLLEDYYRRNEPPELLLYEATNINAKGSNFVTNLRPFLGKSDGLSDLLQDSYPKSYWATELTNLYRYNNELFFRILYYLPKSDQSWINNYRMDSALAENYDPAENGYEDYPLPTEADLAALNRIIETAEAHGTKVVLLVGPYLPAHIENLPDYVDWKAALEVSTGKQLVDFSTAIQETEYFADPLHMNKAGAKVLNPILVEKVFGQESEESH